MDIREAVEDDAARLGELADGPTDVMRNLVHDRTVRVATAHGEGAAAGDGSEGGGDESDGGGDSDGEIVGFVSFDAREGTVHVTQLAGTAAACATLLEEPVRFAEGEGMAVELLVPEDDETVRTAAEDAEFDAAGSGPRFGGTPTTRYRLEPERATQ